MSSVECSGNESRLIDCPANPLQNHTCSHSLDAGVVCSSAINCTEGDVRLQGGTLTQGRVEVCFSNFWGTICDGLWSNADAEVSCRQMGLPSTSNK